MYGGTTRGFFAGADRDGLTVEAATESPTMPWLFRRSDRVGSLAHGFDGIDGVAFTILASIEIQKTCFDERKKVIGASYKLLHSPDGLVSGILLRPKGDP